MATEAYHNGINLSAKPPNGNIDRHLGNLYPEAIIWKKIHGEAVAYIVDKLIVNEINETGHSKKFREELEEYRTRIVFAAKHHDIGLIYLGKDVTEEERDGIVNDTNKKGLSSRGWEIMHRHPMAGARVLEKAGVDDPIILAIVAKHHTLQGQRSYPSEDDPEFQEILSRIPENKRDLVDFAVKLLVLADDVRTIREDRCYKLEESISEAYGKLSNDELWDQKQVSCAIKSCEDSLRLFPINHLSRVLPVRR